MNSIETIAAQNLTDEEALKRVLEGEKHLYEIIMRRYNQRLYCIGMAIVNNSEDAEDVMQVAYIKAYEHLADFKFKSGFGTWLTRIVINESLLQLRKKKRKQELDGMEQKPELNEESPLQTVMNKELRNILENALSQLSEKYRLVFVMREVEDMSINETMECLNLSESNVKVRLNRAKEMLRSSLSKQYKTTELFGFHLTRCDRVVKNVLAFIDANDSKALN